MSSSFGRANAMILVRAARRNNTEERRQFMTDRRRFFRIFFVLLVFGLVSFLRMLGKPGLASVRTVDIVQLIGIGMCLGGALVALAIGLGRPPYS